MTINEKKKVTHVDNGHQIIDAPKKLSTWFCNNNYTSRGCHGHASVISRAKGIRTLESIKLFAVGSPRPYEAFVRLYRVPPKWDGHEYEDNNGPACGCVSRNFLEFLGIKELPVPGGRAVLEIELSARAIEWAVNGDTQCRGISQE